MKRVILLLAVVSLIAVPSFAKKEAGDVSKPTDLDFEIIDISEPNITFTWLPGDDAKPAEKYSLDICGMVLVDGLMVDVPVEDIEVEWCVSFGTSDYNPDNMSAPTIAIPLEDLHLAIFEAIEEASSNAGITQINDVELAEMYAKVKGLDPSDKNPKKRQNNLFSDPLDLMPHPVL